MSIKQPVQYSFAAGELSSLMDMRYDLAGRASGVRTMQNWFCHLQGPAETRDGWAWTESIAGNYGQIFEFFVNIFTSFIVTVTKDKVHISDDNGFISEDDLVENGNFDAGSDDWDVTTVGSGSVVFPGGTCELTPGGTGQLASIEQELVVVAGAEHHLDIQILEGEEILSVSIGNTSGADDIYSETDFIGDEVIHIDGVTATGTAMFIQMVAPGGEARKVILKVSVFDTTIEPVPLEFTSPWVTDTDIALLQVEMPPKQLGLYFVTPGVLPQRLLYDDHTRVWTFEPVPFVSIPAEWTTNNYPRAITFFEGRAYYGGLKDHPEDFWGTRPGDATSTPAIPYYTDLTLGSNPDDAIYYSVAKKGLIQWMQGADTLLIGTENGEHIATSEGGVIIPGDVRVRQQSSNGSAPIKAVLAGNNVLYVSADRRKIRSMSFEWTKDAWLSKDLTFAAEHLTKGDKRITDLLFANSPNSIIWGTTLDGCFIGSTYDAIAQVAGFHAHHSLDKAISICRKRVGGVDQLWALFNRVDDELSLEVYSDLASMDSFLEYHPETPTKDFTGATHLALRECQVLVDGAVHPDVTPNADGDFSLDYVGTEVFIGLGFTAELVTLPRDDNMGLGGFSQGSSQPAQKRWNKLFARILNSWKPKINGRRPPERRASSDMDSIEPAATEDVQVTLLGWDKEASITISQELPLKTVLAGFFGQLDQEVV